MHELSLCPVCQTETSTIERQVNKYKILKCNNCEVVFSWPLRASQDVYDSAYTKKGDYQKYIDIGVDAESGAYHLTWAMRNFLKFSMPKGKLLDIGCSTGAFMQSAKNMGWKVEGVEISYKAAAMAKKLTNSKVFIGKVEEFQSDEKFDAITAWEVLEHVEDPLEFIESCQKLLKPNGILALSTPNWNSPWVKKSNKDEHWPPFHLTFWNRFTIKTLFDKSNLKVIRNSEKPFAWEEEVGKKKWLFLPISLFLSLVLNKKGMHLLVIAQKI